MKAHLRSPILVSILTISLIASLCYLHPAADSALPLALFYALLIFNTYFSVAFFSTLIPDVFSQRCIDTILVILYLLLAFHLGNPLFFVLLLCFFFTLATLKYIFLLGIVNEPVLLKRKITADILGTVMSLLILTGILLGYAAESLWALVSIFAAANVWYLLVRPLYRADAK